LGKTNKIPIADGLVVDGDSSAEEINDLISEDSSDWEPTEMPSELEESDYELICS
jgi:hypothetical protein